MIDVIIPVYNGEKYIIEAIKSVEKQTLKPSNIFIINDGSTDNTEEIIKKYIELSKNSNIKYIKKENGGPNSARNLGLKQSQAEFVAFLDADDIWVQEKLEKQMSIFERKEYSNIGLVYAGYREINEKNEINKNALIVPFDIKIQGNAFNSLLSGNKILGSSSSVLIKKEVFDNVDLFDENLRFGEDWDMWLRIAEKYDINFAKEPLVYIRRHSTNQTNELDKVFLGEIDFFNKWVSKINGIYPIPKRWADQIAFHLIIRFPNINYMRDALKKLSPLAHEEIFKKTFGSAFLYCILFIIRKIFNPSEWFRIIKKIKKYA